MSRRSFFWPRKSGYLKMAAACVVVGVVAGQSAAQSLEFRYLFDDAEPTVITLDTDPPRDRSLVLEATGKHEDMQAVLVSNGPEHRLGEASLTGGDGSSIGLDAPGDGHTTGSFIILTNVPQPESFSYSVWIQPEFTGRGQGIIARDDRWWPSPCSFYCLRMNGDQSLTWKTGGEDTIISEEGLIEENELYHLVVTYADSDGPDTDTADRTTLYVNGDLIDEADTPKEIPSLDAIPDANNIYQLLWLGTMSSFDGFKGLMDDLQMYDGELSAEQVKMLYDNPGSVIGSSNDLNGDGVVNVDDIDSLPLGDLARRDEILAEFNADLGDVTNDRSFDSDDLIETFAAGHYANGEAAAYTEGDWDLNGVFDSDDVIAAFAEGSYADGPPAATAAVPEPNSAILLVLAALGLFGYRRR